MQQRWAGTKKKKYPNLLLLYPKEGIEILSKKIAVIATTAIYWRIKNRTITISLLCSILNP
jgi:hypothetical protein